MNPEQSPVDYNQPVAYDAEGRPLFAHPPKAVAGGTAIQAVQLIRPTEPIEQTLTQEALARHKESKRLFPELNLSRGEYVIKVVSRHMIGIVAPIIISVILITFLLTVALSANQIALAQTGVESTENVNLIMLMLALSVFIAVAAGVVIYIYLNNRFILTNESVIQQIQTSIFSRKEQTVSLANIEDANFSQNGILQHMFNYGSIRLSTQGDENTYTFTFVASPRERVATLNNAVEAFKNGHPVTGE